MNTETFITIVAVIAGVPAAVYYSTVIIELIIAGILDAVDRRRKNRTHGQ